MIQQTKQRFCLIQKKKGKRCHIPKEYQIIIRNSEMLPDEDDDSYSDDEQINNNKQEKHLVNIPVILPSKNLQWLNGQIINNIPKFGDFGQINKTGIKQIKITFISEHLKSFYFSAEINKGSLFVDKLFEPSNKSLTGQWGQIQKFKGVKWVRISQICKNSLFSQKISPNDLVQGKCGNGYLLAAIAALLQKPQRIISLFLTPFRQKQNYYSVKLLKRGKWRIIDLDDYIPTLQGKPITSWTRSKDIWLIILQKAFAKQYSSYMRASIGHIQDAFRDLTGAPIKFFNLREKNANKQNIWKYLLKASRKDYAMCTTILNGSEQKTSFIGWACGYACTLIKAFEYLYKKIPLKIICLRNPWQPITNQHFKNNKSLELHKQLISYIGIPQNQRQGIYFLQFQQFLTEFRSLTVAQINDNSSYICESYNDRTKSGVYFNVSIKQIGYYSFQVDKTPKQLLTSKKLIGYKYPMGTIRIYNMYQNNKLIHQFQDCERLTSRKFLLAKGHYLVYVFINFDKVYDEDFQINLGIYSESICSIELAKNTDIKDIKQPILKQKQVRVKSKSFGKNIEQKLRNSSAVKFHYVSPEIKHKQYSPIKPKQIPQVHLQIKQKIQQNNENSTQDTRGRDLKGEEWVKMQALIHNSEVILQVEKIGQSLAQKQIVYLEPSPSRDKLEELRKSKKDYIDERFPAIASSLSGQWGSLQQWKNVRWQRISKIMPQAKIFQGKITPQSIKQGFLGDCYFLAGIAALAERPDRISNLFLLHEKNQINFYSVKMLYKGKWLTIDMDDYIPYMYDLPAFSRGNPNQLWVILLEKAWAKIYSSYKRIEAGFPQQTLHDLTGAPIRHIYLQKSSFDAEKQWLGLLQASKVEYSMVASSQIGSDYLQSVSGLVDGHAYTLLNALELKFHNKVYRLLQLRNPWGKGESKGAWSDNDPVWNQIDQDTKKSIGYSKLDDGIFFLDYETFCKNFKIITIAQINDNASYVYKSVKDPSNLGCFFKVQILQKGTYSFQVDSTPQRTFQVKYNTQYRYPNISYQMGQLINPKYIKRLTSIQSNTRTSYYKNIFEKGFYICYVKVDFDRRFQKDYDVNLAIYGDFVSNIQLASRNQAILFSNNQSVKWLVQKNKQSEEKVQWNGLRSYRRDK